MQAQHPSIAPLAGRVQNAQIPPAWPLIMAFSRFVFTVIFGLAIVGYFAISKHADPLVTYARWWPFQVIAMNIGTYFLLAYFTRREGGTIWSLLGFGRTPVSRDLLAAAALAVPAFVAGFAGLYGVAYLVWGSQPVDPMFQALPLGAALFVTVAFPVTNVAMETTTYMAYALPRLEAAFKSRWAAIALVAFAYALQHIAIPLVLDWRFVVYRLVGFLPLTLVLGYAYTRLRRMLPILVVHALMDCFNAVIILSTSVAAARM